MYCDIGDERYLNQENNKTHFIFAEILLTFSAYIQSWPKVLRMTQIYIFTKFAASVSLDIFVRCYYGRLKYNYKHLISVKGFY